VPRASNVAWLESLSPWPKDGFGLERMRALLLELGQPQSGLPAVHVVGTNGKSTTTRMVEELLRAHGVNAGAYLSPHVRSWSERIRVVLIALTINFTGTS
jgi:folylpolyglutamate synthase/dihydropteroate synthase